MKAYKTITIISIILLIAIICVASFFGIYKLKDYKVREVVPEYILGMEFTDSRVVELKVDTSVKETKIYDKDGNEITEKQEGIDYTEENGYTIIENKANSDDKLTEQNYKKAKDIIINRLVNLGVEQYTIKQDLTNGNIQIQMTENDNTNNIIENLTKEGTFELADSETKEVLIDSSRVKSTNVVYGQADTGTTVYLQVNLDKEGKKKLEEISKVYVQTTVQTTNEEGETKDSTETKKVDLKLNGETYNSTYFGDTLSNGVLNIPMGTSSDTSSLQEHVNTAKQMSIILNNGILPITYTEEDYVLNNNLDLINNKTVLVIVIAIFVITSILFIVKFKLKGILAIILEIGYIAFLLLALRYTNIKITLEGIVGIVISVILSYIYIYKAFKEDSLNFIKVVTAKFALALIPVYLVAIIFTFNSIANISSLGMTLVWGIITMYLYNLTLTQISVKLISNKQEVENAKK